ncbi:hypothetical protein FB645_001499 [Coemansia sp. IMI 203386]|nr:hypothetical protein FB645_001499 [Coemansia sp. IMI 203386]
MLLSACTAQDGAGAIDAFGRPMPLLPRQLIDPAPQQSNNSNDDGDAQATDGLDSAEEPSQSTRMSTTTVEGSSTSLATTTVSDPSTDQPPQDSETSSSNGIDSSSNGIDSSSNGIDSSSGSEPSSSAPTTDEEPTSATDNTQQSTSSAETDDQATAQTSTVDEDPSTSAGAQPSPSGSGSDSDSDSDSDSTSPDKQAKSSDGLSGGAIAGIVVGVVVGVALIAGGVMLLLWHRRRKSRQASINGDFDSDFPNYHPGVLPPAHGVSASANNNHGAGTAAEHTGMTLPSSYSRPNQQQQQQQPMVHLGDGYINDTYAYQSQNHFNQGFTRQSPPGHETYNGYL